MSTESWVALKLSGFLDVLEEERARNAEWVEKKKSLYRRLSQSSLSLNRLQRLKKKSKKLPLPLPDTNQSGVTGKTDPNLRTKNPILLASNDTSRDEQITMTVMTIEGITGARLLQNSSVTSIVVTNATTIASLSTLKDASEADPSLRWNTRTVG